MQEIQSQLDSLRKFVNSVSGAELSPLEQQNRIRLAIEQINVKEALIEKYVGLGTELLSQGELRLFIYASDVIWFINAPV